MLSLASALSFRLGPASLLIFTVAAALPFVFAPLPGAPRKGLAGRPRAHGAFGPAYPGLREG